MTNLDELLQRLNDKDSKGREEALYALGELGDIRAVEPLIDMLEDPSFRVRRGAAVALGWLKDKRAVEPLLKYLKKAQASEFSSITYALSELKDTKAVEPLIKMALESKSQQIRKPCIRALGKMNDKRAIIPLIEILTKNEALDFLAFTRETLDRMLDAEGIITLIQAFDYSNEAVKWFASKKLSELSEKSFEPLIHAIKEGNGEIRKYSIITIAEMKEIKDIEFLSQFIDDETLKYYVAVALNRGDTQVVNILIEGLTHHSVWIREHSALALGKTKDKKGFNALIVALKDPRREVRAAAALALGELRDEKAIEPLIQAMIDESSENYYTKGALVREAIAEALGKIGGRASDPLLKIAENKNISWNIRFFFLVALVEMGNKQGMDLILEGMNHSLWYMRYNCSTILKRFVKEKKIPIEKIRKPLAYFFDPARIH